MKHIIRIGIAALLVLIAFPFSTSSASPVEKPARDPALDFAPGSIVRFEHLSIEDGLSQNAGLEIFQDSRGYLWIGTQDGLNRYDGYSFRIYKHDPDDPGSISHNSILKITEDESGALWIGTWGGGLNRYDPGTERFTRFQHDPNDPSSLSNDTITALTRDSNGTLWVGTMAGLNRFDAETSTFRHFKNYPDDPESLSSDVISVIFEDSHRQLWIGTGANGSAGSGLNRFDPLTGRAVRYQHIDSDPDSLSSNNIASIYEAGDGTLWIATGGFSLPGAGLNQFDPATGRARHFRYDPDDPHSISGNDLMSLWGDESGMLWIGTWANGLSLMDLSNPGYFTRYQNNPFFSDSLSGNEVWSLFKDRLGILWVGTSHSGINKLSASSGQFSLYRNNPSDPASLGINAIGAFAEDPRGNIWIATWGAGLDRFNPASGQFTHYRHDPENPDSLSDDLFMDVYVDGYNMVWAGTLGKGLDRLDPGTGRVTHFRHDNRNPASIADDNIAAILPDEKGGLWIGTFGGLSHYDPNKDEFTNYTANPDNPAALSQNMVVSLYIDSGNHLWAGTWGGGLNRLDLNDPGSLDPKRAVFSHYRNDSQDPSSLSEDSIWAIHETADGSLWLGTQLGLNRLDPAAKTFTHYTEKQGLPNNVVLGILEDDNADLWLTTNNGLARLDPQTGKVTVFDSSDGLQSNEFNSNAYTRAGNGTLYVGGINGFNLFNPEAIRPNPVPPQVVLTRFEVFNEPMAVDLSGRQPIQLSYRQDFISFEFAAFDFQAPQKNQYAYMLEGFDRDWIHAGSRRYATYTSLPGGEYVFRVKAANSDGTWNETGVAIPVVIMPPVWQTWWFIGTVVVVLGAAVAGGFRWRLNSIREQTLHLETEVAERTTELRETNKLLEREVEQRRHAEAELEKRAAEELYDSEERFRATFDHSAIGIALTTLDGHLLRANPAICKMSGYSEEELKARTDYENTYPEDRHIGMEALAGLLEGRLDSYQIQKRYVRKDGGVFWTQVTLSVVHDAEGRPDYLVAMVEDIEDQKRNLASLRESEARFRVMFDTAAVGITLVAPDRSVLAVNPAVLQMSGYSEAEMLSMTGEDLTYAEDRDVGLQEFLEVISGRRKGYTVEKRYVRKDGSLYWTRLSISAVRDLEGRLLYLVVITEDIDQQKRALENLRESEARFRSMFEHSAIGIGVMGLDRRIIDANPALCRIYGRTHEELLGLSAVEVTYPEDEPTSLQLFNELIGGRRDSYETDRRYIRKNGEVFWAHTTMSSVRGADGRPIYLVGMVIDINEQKHAAEELHKSQAQFQAIFDNVAVGVAVMTLGRRAIAFNAATERIIGYTLDELKDVDPRSLVVPEDRALDAGLFEEMIAGRRSSYVMERRYRHKDGRMFWARINYSLVRDLDGRPDYLVGIIEDIDDQKRAAERLAEQEAEYLQTLQQRVTERTQELEQANQRLQQEIEQRTKIEQELAKKAAEEAVAADRTRLARDLHDAVTQTLFSASLIAEVLPDLWEMDTVEAKKSTEELRQLTRGALAEMRTLLLELRPATLTQTRLSDLIKQLCEAFIGRSRLPIRLTIEGDCQLPPEVQIAIYRIAQESLNNVFKYARATQVDVHLFVSQATLHFETCDNGIGFDMSIIKPTSLGMRIMRERAEAIGADFQITSQPGAGTCVEVHWTQNPDAKLNGI